MITTWMPNPALGEEIVRFGSKKKIGDLYFENNF